MILKIGTYTFPVKDFGHRLRSLREKRGLTQKELSRLAGIDVMLVSRYERDLGYPALETVIGIARALEVSLDYLLLGKTTEEQQPEIFRHLLLAEKLREVDQELGRKEVDSIIEFLDAWIARKRIRKLVNA